MKNSSPYQVLHCHTNLSDGILSHKEVLDKCREYGINTVAFTDHDLIIPESVFSELRALRHPVKFISGIEISATGVKEVRGNIPTFHIIGLFVDCADKKLSDFCLRAKEKRIDRLHKITANLTKFGFKVTEDEVMKLAPDGTVGRPQIVRALLLHEKNEKIISETFERLKIAAETDSSLKTIYEEAAGRDLYGKAFPLFLKEDSFIKNIYVPYLEQVTLDDAVSLIRGAGGITILAHPIYYRDKIDVELIERFAKEKRIDGIETVYAISNRDTAEKTLGKDIEKTRKIINDYGLISAGGGDFHTPEDFEKLKTPETEKIMAETRNFIEKITAKWPDLRTEIY